jgi:glycosyltransferase involved in cell wall biosynthesis
MRDDSLVSIIIPFLNAEKFLPEAVQSVFAQTYDRWELLLVDDGSRDQSSDLARRYAAQNPSRIKYLEHPGHQNRGVSASRNLGLGQADGEYLAFLDADDVWLPHKLERQTAIMLSQPSAALVYGASEYWYSWTTNPEDRGRDYIQLPGIATATLVQPPALLFYFLQGKAAIPPPCNILVRREAFELTAGFEEQFRAMYEDQAFYAKLCLRAPVFVSHECWDRYRQHPNSLCSVAAQSGQTRSEHLMYLDWLKAYLLEKGFEDTHVWKALRRELLFYENPRQLTVNNISRYVARRYRKLWKRIVGPRRLTSLKI